MKTTKNPSVFFFFLFILALVFFTFSISSIEARKQNTKKSKPHNTHLKNESGGRHGNTASFPGPPPSPLPSHGAYPARSSVFDVLSFGAKGDGVSDDSEALLAAWKAACKVPGATVEIRAKSKFLIRPIILQGPCMPDLVLEIDGTVLAPTEPGAWPKSSLFDWLRFQSVNNFTIQGTGTVDGRGSKWWGPSMVHFFETGSNLIPDTKPTAISFYGTRNVTVRDIKIINSPQFHLKFENSALVKVNNIAISSPENSPNTDGIHFQNTQDVELQHSNISCGDDCVSIQTGSSNVHVHHINCGPGHGISIGGLGKDNTAAFVSNVIVEKISLQNTQTGGRIKTWQGGSGSVKNVTFADIQVSDVRYPVIIDQYYCPDEKFCKNQTKAVAISGVTYERIIGTYLVQPIHLACSNNVPCTNINLIDIQLKPSLSGPGGVKQAFCWNAYGKSQAPLVPPSIGDCLRRGNGDTVKRIARSHEHVY